MAVTVVATAGSASANSFATVVEADAYLEARLNASAWTGDEPKKKALIEATRELDRLAYQGYRTDSTQALSWPREGVIDIDAPVDEPLGGLTGHPEYDDDEIPTRLKEATIELAFEFLKAGTTDIAAVDRAQGVIRKKVDIIETEWTPGARPAGLSRYPRVIQRLLPLLAASDTNEVVRA